MAESFIPLSLQRLWSVWNIRGFMILSLFLQVLLASITQHRQTSNNKFILFVIWLAYFMADWTATFTFGLISNARCNISVNPPETNENLLAFWAAFLLIHLGGPDTITAFSLEDNALWPRHLVGLVAQLFTFSCIFLKTLPDNNLIVPTVLVAVAGAIKYGERTRALYLASMENLKKSIVKLPDLSHGDSSAGESSFYFFQIFKGLVVDIAPNHAEQLLSREFILSKGASEAFGMIARELGLLYDMFYKKILALNSAWGILSRTITCYIAIAALVLYCLSKKEGVHEVDVWITFFLLGGVIALELSNGDVLLVSDWSNTGRWYHGIWVITQGICFIIPGTVVALVIRLFDRLLRRFVGLDAFNLLLHCYRQELQGDNKLKKHACTIARFFTTYRDISRNVFDEEIQKFIFDELKGRALFANDADKVKKIFEARGNWTLTNLGNIDEFKRYVIHFDYDRSLLSWHVATEICYNTDGAVDGVEGAHKEFAKIFSDYMNYLLIKKPQMMSAVVGIGHIRYRDTCSEVKHFCRVLESKTVNEFCTRLLDELTRIEPAHVYKDKGASVLSDACNLAKALRLKDKKWEIISGVWVEILTYAAGHCRPEEHVRALSEGGEVVTAVWLLMAHFGIGQHFPYPED